MPLKLVTAEASGSTGRAGGVFSLLFVAPSGPWLPQATYPVKHPTRGTMEIFLVPIGAGLNLSTWIDMSLPAAAASSRRSCSHRRRYPHGDVICVTSHFRYFYLQCSIDDAARPA